ncbi:NepR family anti-sigma factor [Novosphingobium bradum]|uniref:NepR family anti-sigma factor n=1 Tax=Novosphingobium bradum TaxID=1737444 RepID=A0ABV7IKZ2_9SPHN
MTNDKATKPMRPAPPREGRRAQPEWADGLKQLYDAVLDEPLPDSFADLIAKLDESGK